jgi:hypothetical protein
VNPKLKITKWLSNPDQWSGEKKENFGVKKFETFTVENC